MVEQKTITGIKRKATAVEGTVRFFQTVDLLIERFKREADRNKIFELVNDDSTLKHYLLATSAVYLYHYLGIRVKASEDQKYDTLELAKTLEMEEKSMLMEEINFLLGNSFEFEIDTLYKIIDFESIFISYLIQLNESRDNVESLSKIENKIESEILEIILKNHPFYFYDFFGELIGITDKIKTDILEESSQLKDLSIELEKKLEREEKEDKFIELSTLNRLVDYIQKSFEFKSYKELQTSAMPVRMIKKKIIDFETNRFPISLFGLNAFQKANHFKKEIVSKIEKALKEKIDYDEFESSILEFLRIELISQLKEAPNDFIYFLEKLSETSFSDTIYTLNKFGVYNILDMLNIDDNISEEVNRNMIRYNINKYDLMLLNDPKKNYISRLKLFIDSLEFKVKEDFLKEIENLEEYDLLEYISNNLDKFEEFWLNYEERSNISSLKLKEFIQKKKIVDKIFLEKLNLRDYSQILLVLNFREILSNLVKEIFYSILSKIIRQLGRIIELYNKVINEKTLFLLTFKKMEGLTETEDWVHVKLEELLIKRIINRQKEISIVFDAADNAFLVNGFILARLKDASLMKSIEEVQSTPSPIFDSVKPLILNNEIISPISYCLAYDLIKRLEIYDENRKEKVKEIIKEKELKQEIKKEELREKQKSNTFNWIERRITSALMRITSSGINPNQLYWNDKDLRIVTENIKLHSEISDDVISHFIEFFNFAITKISSFTPEMNLPNEEKSANLIIEIVNNVLESKVGKVSANSKLENILDGDRFEISKRIGAKIGKLLDKALYFKFKKRRK